MLVPVRSMRRCRRRCRRRRRVSPAGLRNGADLWVDAVGSRSSRGGGRNLSGLSGLWGARYLGDSRGRCGMTAERRPTGFDDRALHQRLRFGAAAIDREGIAGAVLHAVPQVVLDAHVRRLQRGVAALLERRQFPLDRSRIGVVGFHREGCVDCGLCARQIMSLSVRMRCAQAFGQIAIVRHDDRPRSRRRGRSGWIGGTCAGPWVCCLIQFVRRDGACC